jgi:hypothetical protein
MMRLLITFFIQRFNFKYYGAYSVYTTIYLYIVFVVPGVNIPPADNAATLRKYLSTPTGRILPALLSTHCI